jgi:acyl dehydratase
MTNPVFEPNEVWVGRDYGGATYEITPELVATYIAGTGDDNPWYREASPIGAPVAPALILHSAQYRKTDWYLSVYGNLHTRLEWDSWGPIMVGDRITSRAQIVERYSKRDRDYLVNEVIFSNQSGRMTGRSRTHQSFLIKDERRESGFVIDKSRERDSSRNFKIGERGGEAFASPMITISDEMCMAFSGPARNYHNDKAKAIELGFPEIVVQGMMSVCMIAGLMTRRFDMGFIHGGRLDVRLVNIVWGNDTTAARGLIVERRPEGKRTRAECEVWCEKSDGTKTIVGSASALEL